MVCAAPACASQGSLYRYPGGSRSVDQRAFSVGYDQGRQRGDQDARRRRRFDYQRHGDYRAADVGYRGYVDRNGYRAAFRQGFVAGYNDGYRRYGPSGYGDVGIALSSAAARTGYRDGYQQGRDDAHGGGRFDPLRARGRYRSSDRDYDRRYGSRDDYKREYRAAFQAGYEEGFRGSRRH
jgi:hypothetical protein